MRSRTVQVRSWTGSILRFCSSFRTVRQNLEIFDARFSFLSRFVFAARGEGIRTEWGRDVREFDEMTVDWPQMVRGS